MLAMLDERIANGLIPVSGAHVDFETSPPDAI
jgi:hypothetical protein